MRDFQSQHGVVTAIEYDSPVIQEALKKVEADFDSEYLLEVHNVLLPHQRKRFKELRARTELHNTLTSKSELKLLKDSLNITDAQMDDLRSNQKKFNASLEKEIAELREKRQREFLDKILNDEQMETLDKLIGDPIKSIDQEN